MAHSHAHHDHPHGEHDHVPQPGGASARRALVIALVLTAGFAIVEAVGGWIAGSLALLSDAGHMLTDAAALGLALFADAVARRPPSKRASYGYGRAEVLAAFVNAIAMLAVVALIAIEAVRRLLEPAPVAGGIVAGIAAVGLGVNLFAAWILSRASGSLNARGALLHVMGDLLGSLAALIAGGVILATGWTPIDPILSLAVALVDRALDMAAPEAVDRRADGRRADAPRLRRDRPLARLVARRGRRARPAHLEHVERRRRVVGALVDRARRRLAAAPRAGEADARVRLRDPPCDAAADVARAGFGEGRPAGDTGAAGAVGYIGPGSSFNTFREVP